MDESSYGTSRSAKTISVDLLTALVNAWLLFVFAAALYLYAGRDCASGDEVVLLDAWRQGRIRPSDGWPFWECIVPCLAYRCLGIETVKGLQLVGAALSVASAIGVNYLVITRFRLRDGSRAVALTVFNAFLCASGPFHYLARWAVLAYPIRVFAGFVIIYLLATYAANGSWPRKAKVIVLGMCLSLLVYAHHILVLPLCAVFAASGVIGWQRQRNGLWQRIQQAAMPLLLLTIPLVTGILVWRLDPHQEVRRPRDVIQGDYFWRNEHYARNPLGYTAFVLERSRDLLEEAVALPRVVRWPGYDSSAVLWVPLLLFAVGLAVSFTRRDDVRFALAVYLLFDLALRLGANLAGWLPYGTIRYALSTVYALQLMTALGAADLLRFGYAAWSRLLSKQSHLVQRAGRVVLGGTIILAACLVFACGAWVLIAYGGKAARYARDAQAIRDEYGALRGETCIVTENLSEVYYTLGPGFAENNTLLVIPKMFIPERHIAPAELQRLAEAIRPKGRILTITYRGFGETEYREVYHVVSEQFRCVEGRALQDAWFATWVSGELPVPSESSGF